MANYYNASDTSNVTSTCEDGVWTYGYNAEKFPIYVPMQPQDIPVGSEFKKVDDSPLAWLRREVDEICELARAA